MLKDVVNIIKDISLRHRGVRTFRYQSEILNNAQNNHKTYQVYLDTVSLHQLNITTNIFTSSFELYILSQPTGESGNTIEDVQTYAFTIAVDILGALDTWEAYKGVVSLHDYSILTVSEYTDDNAAGVKLSLVLQMPNPVNLCTLDDNFNDEPYEDEPDNEIDINNDEIGDIDIRPIELPTNRIC